jgi:amino acid adenylation domain-containing protein
MPYALRLRGALDVGALRASLDALVRRHEPLRTVFAERGGAPVQVIRPPAPVPLPVLELGGLPAREREREAERLAGADAMRPFDLARGPLLRSTLLRLAADDHVICFNLHHVVSDGWSMQVLVREVSTMYAAFCDGEEPRLPELPVQYADFAVWQRGWLSGETLEAQLAYWRARLAGAPPVLELPTDFPRPPAAVASGRGGSRSITVSPGTSQALRALGRAEGATLFMTLLGAWQLLLARYSGREDVIVGTPIAGRTRLETEGLIGFFANTLVLRTGLEGDPDFAALLARVREGTLGAYAHQDLPFERLVEELQPERMPGRTPLFQVMFSLQNLGQDRLRMGDLEMEPVGAGAEVVKFDLNLSMGELGEAIGARLAYRADLYEDATAERMLGHLGVLLEGIAAAPGGRLSELSLLTGAERARVLQEWNATAAPFSDGLCLHELVEVQAARAPGAPALAFGDEVLTYAELDGRANRLARALSRRGVGPETRVALLQEPGVEAIVSLLATLKAGGAYVPLDVSSPPERLRYMLADSGARLALASPGLADAAASAGVPVLTVDAGALAGDPADGAEAPRSGVEPRNLAYVIYTSGSTGRPKGVLVEHRGVCNGAEAFARVYGITPASRVLLFAPLHFDASVLDVFTALATGATLVVAPRAELLPGAELVELLERQRVTHAKFTPGALAATPWAELPHLEAVMSGGEACSAEVVGRWAPGRRFFNGYGPTEASVRVTVVETADARRPPPIGRAVANVRLYVLDSAGEPSPVGVPGELCIGGVGVARGYLGRAGLSAEVFVPDPYSGEPGARLYRSGDRVRWRADGQLDFIGRVDDQVKIRGFRVEPGEIEAVLLRHPGVREAVVAVREDVPGDRRLVAYLVPHAGIEAAAADLRAYLRDRLPEYMVPGAFVVLEALPLTPSGKTDRRALPAPARGGAEREGGSPDPRDALETTLCGIFQEALGIPRVGLRDSFFELGGHSLLAVQIMSRLEEATGVRLPVAVLFRAPTVELLAEEVRRGGGGETPLLVPLRPGGSRTPLFLVHPVGGEVMAYSALTRRLHPEQPVYALRSRGIEPGEKPSWTVEEMARDYLAAIRRVQPAGPYRLGGWSMGGVVAYEMARQLEAAGEETEKLVLIDSQVPWLHDPKRTLPRDEILLVQSFAQDLGLAGGRMPAPDAETRAAGGLAYLRRLLEGAHASGLVPGGLDLGRMQHLYGIFRINLTAAYEYRPGSYGGPVTLLRATERRLAERLFRKKSMGWERVVRRLEVRMVPGTHYTMVREPRVEALAREVERAFG